MKANVEVSIRATIEVPDDAVLRCTENHDEDGNPQPPGRDTPRGWRDIFYDLREDEDVFRHIAFNLLYRQHRFSMLDGWADLEDNDAQVADESVDIMVWEIEP